MLPVMFSIDKKYSDPGSVVAKNTVKGRLDFVYLMSDRLNFQSVDHSLVRSRVG